MSGLFVSRLARRSAEQQMIIILVIDDQNDVRAAFADGRDDVVIVDVLLKDAMGYQRHRGVGDRVVV